MRSSDASWRVAWWLVVAVGWGLSACQQLPTSTQSGSSAEGVTALFSPAPLVTGSGASCTSTDAEGTPCDDGLTCTLGETCHAGACQPSAQATCTPGSSVSFYLSYDNGSMADIAGGPRTPQQGPVAIVPAEGLFGPGIDGSTTVEMSYGDPTGTSISLAKPGSLSYWMKTQDGHVPVGILTFDRFPRTNLFAVDHGPIGAGADVYFDAGGGVQAVETSVSGVPLSSWANDGFWHLVVINWTPTKLAVSVDGGPLMVNAVDWLKSDHAFDPGVGSQIYAGGSNLGSGYYHGSADEFIILNRPMSSAEIAWYWSQRNAGGPSVRNPAPEHFNANVTACNRWDDLDPSTTDACTKVTGITHALEPNPPIPCVGDALSDDNLWVNLAHCLSASQSSDLGPAFGAGRAVDGVISADSVAQTAVSDRPTMRFGRGRRRLRRSQR